MKIAIAHGDLALMAGKRVERIVEIDDMGKSSYRVEFSDGTWVEFHGTDTYEFSCSVWYEVGSPPPTP